MAQDSGSFLYQIKLNLDASDAANDYGVFVDNIRSKIGDLKTAMTQLQDLSPTMSMQDLDIRTSPQSLQEMADASDQVVFSQQRLKDSIEATSTAAQTLQRPMIGAAEEALDAARATQRLRQSAVSAETPFMQLRAQIDDASNGVRSLENAVKGLPQTTPFLSGVNQRVQQADASLKQMVGTTRQFSAVQTQASVSVGKTSNNLSQSVSWLSDLKAEAVKAGNATENLNKTAGSLVAPFRQARSQVANLNNAVNNLGSTSTFTKINSQSSAAAKTQAQLAAQVNNTSKAQKNLNKSLKAGNSRYNKTTQTSQNLLRILQDSEFGMMGMANNFQALGESLGRASARGVSALTQLKRGLMALVSGPMLIPAVITALTLLASNWEKVTGAVSRFSEQLGLIDWDGTNDDIEDMQQKLQSLRDDFPEFQEVLSDLTDEQREGFTEVIERKIEQLQNQQENIASIVQSDLIENETYGRLSTDIFLPDAAPQEILDAVTGLQGQYGRKTDVSLVSEDVANMLRRQVERTKELRSMQELVNIETEEREHLITLVMDKLQVSRERAEELLAEEEEQVETQRRRNEEIERGIDLQALQIEAMEEGLSKQIAQIRHRIETRKEEIRQMEDLTEGRRQAALALLDDIQENQIDQAFEDATLDNTILIPGVGVLNTKEFLDQQRDEFKRVRERLSSERQALRDERDIGETEGYFEELGARQLQFQVDMMEREEELRKERLRARVESLQGRAMVAALQGDVDRADQLSSQAASVQEQVASTEKRWQEKRKAQQMQFLRDMVNNIESTPLGDAWADTFNTIGGIVQTFNDDRLNWEEKTQSQKAQIIATAGSNIVGAVSNIAEQSFQSWKSKREQELKEEGKTQEERSKILREEGKKRFQMMKNIKYASAAVSGVEAQLYAWTKGMEMGGLPTAIAMSAASAAKTAVMLKQISSMSIGDRISGGGGAGAPGGKFTQRSANSAASAAASLGTGMSQRRNNNQDTIKKTASEVGRQVAKNMPDSVTMDRRTAEQANEAANRQKTKLNK